MTLVAFPLRSLALLLWLVAARGTARAEDCNRNGVEDVLDLRPGAFRLMPGGEISSSGKPYGIASGDLDMDGLSDFAVANFSASTVASRTVTVVSSRAGGRFDIADHTVGREPTDLVLADLDGDGDLDIATTGSDEVSVVTNWGQGKFSWPLLIFYNRRTHSIVATDLDADGDKDLAATLHGQGELALMANPGNAAFEARAPVEVGSSTYGLTSADLDGDGAEDLIVAASLAQLGGHVAVFLGGSAGSLASPARYETSQVRKVVSADLNGDGDPDIAVTGAGGKPVADPASVEVLRGLGDGKLAAPMGFAVESFPVSLTAGDLDADGDGDLAVAHETLELVSVLLNDGSAAFHVAATRALGWKVLGVTAVDLNGDSVVDLATANRYQQENVLVENGTISILVNETVPPVSRDVDRDGIPDECQSRSFRRGDVDGNGTVDLADPIMTLNWLFLTGEAPGCLDAADVDDGGSLDISDTIRTLHFLFLSGPPPAAPGAESCGPDPAPDDLGCLNRPSCEGR